MMEDKATSLSVGRTHSSGTAPITQNIVGITGGQATNVFAIGYMHGDIHVESSNPVQKLREHTHEKLQSHTEGMIKVSGVEEAIQKLQEKNWVTVTGNAGEGKTTLGYMVLKQLNSEDVFHVDTPEEFSQVSKQGKPCTVMLNDAFGQFSLDLSAFNRWRQVICNILDEHEKSEGHPTRIIFISRWNLLQTAKDYLERCGEKILHPDVVINLSDSKHGEERLEILNYHLNKKNIQISEDVKQQVSRSNTPHGFAHCCKIYTELKEHERPDIEDFFKSPLKFLNATTRVLVRTGYMDLFKMMIKEDGMLTLGTIQDDKQQEELRQAVSDLTGSYITEKSGSLSPTSIFTHPSIYESVVIVIGEKNCLFIVKNASVSVLMQMVNIKEHNVMLSGVVNIDPEPTLLDALCERFRPDILERNFTILEHKFCDNRYFCERLIQTCVHKDQDTSRQVTPSVSINETNKWDRSMLHTAAIGGRPTAVRVLLEHGADMNKATPYGWTALHYLCRSDRPDTSTLQLLISHGICIDQTDKRGRTGLHYLCERDRVDDNAIRLLITHGADVDKGDVDGTTPLHCLCRADKEHVKALQVLIGHGADVNKADRQGNISLHYLCKSCKEETRTLKLLITHGADVNKTDLCDKSALHDLCESGKVDASILQLMISHGAHVNTTDTYGETTLHHLCKSEKADTSTLELLINHGADVTETDDCGNTALHYLCELDEVDISSMELLITHGADVNASDVDGETVLRNLFKSDNLNPSTLEVLVNHGYDVKAVDEFGCTALLYLCARDKADVYSLQLLISHGADMTRTDDGGDTALHFLCKGGKADTSVLQLLVSHGIDVNTRDTDGKTALHFLCQSDKIDSDTLSFLISHGADVNAVDDDGKTGLSYLTDYSNTRPLQLLVGHGADVNTACGYGSTVLHDLCEFYSDEADVSVIKLLATHGADWNKTNTFGTTALHYLCENGKVDKSTLQLLIDHGADVNVADRKGTTTLDYLHRYLDDDTIQLLMSKNKLS